MSASSPGRTAPHDICFRIVVFLSAKEPQHLQQQDHHQRKPAPMVVAEAASFGVLVVAGALVVAEAASFGVFRCFQSLQRAIQAFRDAVC